MDEEEGEVDVKYAPPFDDVEIGVRLERVRSIGQTLNKARALRALRIAPWDKLLERVEKDIGPQPNYIARSKRGKRLLYTHEQAKTLAGDSKRQRTVGSPEKRVE